MPTLRNRVVYVKNLSELKEQIADNSICCVHFATEWCPPSKDMEAVINTMARDFEDEVVFVHCDLDQVDEILYEMPIKALPTVIIFRDSKGIGKIEGMKELVIRDVLKKALG